MKNTKKAFEKLRILWKGAKWNIFIRRWLGRRRSSTWIEELVYKLMGYRKKSLLGDIGRRLPGFYNVPRKEINIDDEIDLSGGVEINQGKIGSCACCTLCAILQDYIIRETKDKTIEVDWQTMWNDMKSLGLADDRKGSYLEDNLWYAQKYGLPDSKGNFWKIDKLERISRNDIAKYVRMGYQVYTGAGVGSPMCDKNWYFKIGQRKYYHAFRVVGIREKMSLLFETTWLNYGYKRESQFFGHLNDTNSFMSPYVMTWKKI